MTAQDLKNAILQLAVQGKLVPQDPNDEPASELLKRIKAEKERLVKEGKIKKEKNLPEITEEDIPFEIPESWAWVRIGDIWSVINGDRGQNYPAKSTLSHAGIPFISALNLNGKTVINDDNLLCLSETQYQKLGNGKLVQGDIVVCIRGSLGKHGRYPFEKGAIASSLVILRSSLNEIVLDNFLMLYLDAPLFFCEIKRFDNGTAQPNLAAKSLEKFLIPLPPLAEQERIVAKIEELMPLVEKYEIAEERLTVLNAEFPDKLRKSILQQAIQGKLTERNPADEPASELLNRIRTEKERLIKEGKIKKEKPLPPIAEEEVPFDIPDGWVWVRLQQIVFSREQETPTERFSYIDIGSIDNQRQCLNTKETLIDPENAPSRARKLVELGDILYSTVRPYLHNMCIIDREFSYKPIASTGFAVLACCAGVYNKYLFYYLLSPAFDNYVNDTAKGAAYPAINDNQLLRALIPLPPFAEQQRIVDRVNKLLTVCDELK